MPNVEEVMVRSFKAWYTTGMNYTIGVIRKRWLSGPRPKRLGVVNNTLRGGVNGVVTSDGYKVGTRVKHGIYWEQGIKAHKVRAKGKALMIPVGSAIGRWGKKLTRKTGLRKIKGGKARKREGNLIAFRKSAFIPKQEPRKWLEPGIKDALPAVLEIGRKCLDDSMKYVFLDKTVGPK